MMYPDVPPEHWAYTDIQWARWLRIMVGDPQGYFHPNDPITRAEAAAVAVRTVARSVEISAGLMALGALVAVALSKRGR